MEYPAEFNENQQQEVEQEVEQASVNNLFQNKSSMCVPIVIVLIALYIYSQTKEGDAKLKQVYNWVFTKCKSLGKGGTIKNQKGGLFNDSGTAMIIAWVLLLLVYLPVTIFSGQLFNVHGLEWLENWTRIQTKDISQLIGNFIISLSVMPPLWPILLVERPWDTEKGVDWAPAKLWINLFYDDFEKELKEKQLPTINGLNTIIGIVQLIVLGIILYFALPMAAQNPYQWLIVIIVWIFIQIAQACMDPKTSPCYGTKLKWDEKEKKIYSEPCADDTNVIVPINMLSWVLAGLYHTLEKLIGYADVVCSATESLNACKITADLEKKLFANEESLKASGINYINDKSLAEFKSRYGSKNGNAWRWGTLEAYLEHNDTHHRISVKGTDGTKNPLRCKKDGDNWTINTELKKCVPTEAAKKKTGANVADLNKKCGAIGVNNYDKLKNDCKGDCEVEKS